MDKITPEITQFLDDLNEWMPWIFKRGEAPTHLKTEYPLLTLEESQSIVHQWMTSKPKLLNESWDNDVGC